MSLEKSVRERLDAFLVGRFRVLETEGRDKVVPLGEVLRPHVRSGDVVHFSTTHAVCYAQAYEFIRQFRGTGVKVELASMVVGSNLHFVLAAGMVSRIVTSYAGDGYPRPSPSPVVQRALNEGVAIQNWTVLTMTQRFLAGALGVEWFPTRSLVGSSMEEENRGDYRREDGQGYVRALRPDVSLVHVDASDPQGNSLVVSPSIEGLFPEFAARRGVIVTAERIVSTAEIRRHAHHHVIPGHRVLAVAHAPYGAHPGNHQAPDGTGYTEDHPFLIDYRRSAKKRETLEAWMKEWVYEVDHAGYLEKLGRPRLDLLRARFGPETWRHDIEPRAHEFWAGEATPTEAMVCTAARRLEERIRQKGYPVLLAGQGGSNLAAWLAYQRLQRTGVPLELLAEMGIYGYNPRPGSPFIFNSANNPTAKSLSHSLTALGMLTPEAMAVLSGAQVDPQGNLNSTRVGPLYLVGSGGANDAASVAREVLLLLAHDKTRLIKKLPYITSPGRAATTLVTTLGVLEKIDGELTLTSLLPGHTLEEARKNTGWPLRTREPLATEPPADPDDLAALRMFDPDGHFRAVAGWKGARGP